jgi:glycosyltransferase involved in cell wall biosynthesis
MNQAKVKVLYIGGYSRSGSTLLLRFLGHLPNFVGVGEVWDIWRRSFMENQLCGCGQPFNQCEFWGAVVQDAFGGFDQVDAQAMQALRQSVQSNHQIPLLAIPALRPASYRAHLKAYTDVLGRLYQGIQHVSGGKIIVDSSKVPPYAFLLNQVDAVDLHVVQLVRDSRATAYSWQRKKIRPEIHWKTTYMAQYSPVRSALEWNVMNGLLQSLKYSNANYLKVHYEELVQDPRAVLERILSGLGQQLPPGDILTGDHVVELGVDHTLSGNPNRFEQGGVKIKPDIEWQTKMPARQKAVVTGLTLPLLWSYGYLGRQGLGAASRSADLERVMHQPCPQNGNGMRILLVAARYLPYVGGTEIHTFEVARRLVAAGNNVTILTTNPESKETTVEDSHGLHVIRVPAWPRSNDYYIAPSIYGIIRNGDWDIVHCQGYHTMVAPITMLAAWRARIPYVVTFHSGGHSSWLRNALRPVQRALLAPLLARASVLVGVSAWEADFFRRALGLPRERFAVIPNGSYLPRPEVMRADVADENLIVSVGRLERYKGHHQVIGALPAVLRECPGAHLRIVGTGPYESALRQLAEDLGVSDRVTIGGLSASDREGMADLLLRASLVILLSSYESQSVSAMEALALGRPVLVADNTALHELAASGLARATAPGSTPEAVATAILGQLRQPLFPANTELPSWDACAEAVLDVYRRSVRTLTPCAS